MMPGLLAGSPLMRYSGIVGQLAANFPRCRWRTVRGATSAYRHEPASVPVIAEGGIARRRPDRSGLCVRSDGDTLRTAARTCRAAGRGCDREGCPRASHGHSTDGSGAALSRQERYPVGGQGKRPTAWHGFRGEFAGADYPNCWPCSRVAWNCTFGQRSCARRRFTPVSAR